VLISPEWFPLRSAEGPQVERPRASLPQIAPGTELLGEYRGSGFLEPQYLVRRGDGQFIQLPRLLYLLAFAVSTNGPCDSELLAETVSRQLGRQLTRPAVEYLLEDKLRPLGLLASEEGHEPARATPILSLGLRTVLLPRLAVGWLAAGLQALFWPPIVVVLLSGLVVVDCWLFIGRGVSTGINALLSQPGSLLLVYALIVTSALFHELGHASACRYGGAQPGVIGAGVYLVWPAFYTNVTDAYRLSRWGRIRVDLGGVYFNAIFIVAAGAAYMATGLAPFLAIFVLTHFQMLEQLLPFVRFDGYYVLSDFTGVPDLFSRVGPIVRDVVGWGTKTGPGSAPKGKLDPRAQQLRRGARAVVATWVLVTIPFIGFCLISLILRLPAFLATSWRSVTTQVAVVVGAATSGDVIRAGAAAVSAILLILPVAGAGLLLYRLGHWGGRSGLRWSSGRCWLRAALLLAVIGSVTVLLLWWSEKGYLQVQHWKG
jgi:putative peptide zinc metalloprotease protein